jgi:predicted aldo/keto reductase-like oxidoreductase
MDRILFGDNQFFGVNHMSEEKARAQAMKFRDTKAIMDVLDIAYDMGIKTFMCTTHDRIGEVCDIVRANPQRYKDFEFYPCMPYAHKYANSVGEVGIYETIKRFAPGGIMESLIKGAIAGITQDIDELMRMLVDSEMKRFQGLTTKVIFVQNVVTDLLLGMKLYDMFASFHEHIRKRYNAEAGFITMNMPALLDVLEKVGVANPIICANINKIGFRMSGGIPLYEKVIRERKFRPIAMSVLASGAIPPEEAIRYVCDQPNIESIVFGASSRGNIKQTKDLIDKLTKPGRAS